MKWNDRGKNVAKLMDVNIKNLCSFVELILNCTRTDNLKNTIGYEVDCLMNHRKVPVLSSVSNLLSRRVTSTSLVLGQSVVSVSAQLAYPHHQAANKSKNVFPIKPYGVANKTTYIATFLQLP